MGIVKSKSVTKRGSTASSRTMCLEKTTFAMESVLEMADVSFQVS